MRNVSAHVLAAFIVFTTSRQVMQTYAVDNSGQEHFNLMVDSVNKIASELANVYETPCGTTGEDCACSQDMCKPLPESTKCFTNTIETNDLYNCSRFWKEKYGSFGSEKVCPSIKVTSSTSVSFVRSNLSDTPTNRQKSTICRTQQLQEVLQSQYNKTKAYTEFYVGMIDGTYRGIPGREESADSCYQYDARKRPWYSGAMMYPNHLVIVVDCGHMMDLQPAVGKPADTRLDVAKRFALSLLDTVYVDNYVNVFSFGASKDDIFTSSVQVKILSDHTQDHPELEGLKEKIRNLSTAEQSTGPLQFATGLNTSLKAFSEQRKGLLNVIIITDGSFTDGSFTDGNFSSDPHVIDVLDKVKEDDVHLFFYSIEAGLSKSDLERLSDDVHGFHHDVILTVSTDPLFTMQSYFRFLATSHVELFNGTPFWSRNYEDYYGKGTIVTVTKPAITRNGLFVGVAAIDIAIDGLEPKVKPDFDTEVKNRRDIQDRNLTNASNKNISNLTFPVISDDDSCAGGVQSDSVLCTPGDGKSEDLNDRKCCDSCRVPSDDGNDGKSRKMIILGSVFGVAVLATIGTIVFVSRRKKKRKVREPPIDKVQIRENLESDERWRRPS